jgi:uncharacterized protein (DUF58 family)
MKAKKLRINVVSLLKKLEIILKMLVDTQIISRYRSVFKGKGLEFEDFREYTTSDDASRIDWKTSARTNTLLVKLFREERELDVYILLDTSSSMIFGSTEKLKMEYAAEIAAAFAFMVSEAADKIGLIMFNDKITKIVPPNVGKKHFQVLLNHLVNAEYYGGGYDLQKALNFTMKISKKKGLMIIISDFIGLQKGWEKALRLTAVKFDIIGIMVRDPRDETMPEEEVGQYVLEHPYSNYSLLIDPAKIAKAYAEYVKKQDNYIHKQFTANNADFLKISTSESFIKPLISYFMMRKARITRFGF